MQRPNSITKYDDIDLKLGIKSSLPNVKPTLALLLLIWRVSDKAATLDYCTENGNEIQLDSSILQKMHSVVEKVSNEEECPSASFDALVNCNQMLKSQLEALIVAFELVWKLAKIRFVDEHKPTSAERTGGKRYPKRLWFTINMDLLDLLFQSNMDEYTKVLLKWLGIELSVDSNCETTLLHMLTVFSEGAVYKLVDNGNDIVFNLNSLYEKLLTSTEPVDINGDAEPKGSLRILKSGLSDGMNPFLRYQSGSVSLESDPDATAKYSERVDTFLSLSTSKIVGIDGDKDTSDYPPGTTDDEEDEYTRAARILTDYVYENGTQFSASDEEIEQFYQQFRDRFSPDKLAELTDDKLLGEMFYTSDKSNDSLCYWLEFNAFCKKQFGSISGGSAYKFCLFQKQDDGIWMTGSGQKPEPLSEEEALKLGKEIRDALVAGANLIGSTSLDTVDAYEQLCNSLDETIGRYSGYAWVHKYYQIMYPDKLVAFHIEPWQRHILYAFGIKPCDKFYARSGQLSLIARQTTFNTPHFAEAVIDRFGDVIQFCRIGSADDKQSYFSEWRQKGIVAIGWNGIGSLGEFVSGGSINRSAIFDKMTEVYYPTDNRVASRKAGELVTFYAATKTTVFVAMNGEQLLSFGDDVGAYFYDETNAFAHCRPIHWHCRFTDGDRLPEKSEGLRTSCKAFAIEDNIMYLYHKYYFETDITTEGSVESEMPTLEVKPREPRTDKTHPLNQIIYGAPGTGKTYSSAEFALAIIERRPVDLSPADSTTRHALMERYHAKVAEGYIVFTTFHQSYGYEEFIQGIRPDSTSGAINFVKADGIFKRLADKALADPDNNYVIIIDEINRGNISKVFGELITLIEDDKRYGELNQLTVTLPLGGIFAVPNNLYIIGTMNSADKSISLIDTALRRRFEFVEMPPDTTLVTEPVLRGVLEKLNTYLYKELRSTDLLVGHAFFIGKDVGQLADIMNRSIIPLLYEYFYDDEAKVKKALDCMQGTNFEVDNTAGRRVRVIKKD